MRPLQMRKFRKTRFFPEIFEELSNKAVPVKRTALYRIAKDLWVKRQGIRKASFCWMAQVVRVDGSEFQPD